MMFEESLQEVQALAKQDKLLQAYSLLQRITEEIKTAINEGSPDSERLQRQLYDIQLNRTFITLEDEATAVLELLEELKHRAGWNLVHDSDGIKTWYQHDPKSPVHSLKMEGTIHQPIFNVCSVINEIDLYMTWIPRITEARLVEQSSRFHKIAYVKTQSMWPVAARDTCMYGYGVDLIKEKGCVVVMVRSCRHTDPHNHPPAHHRVVRVETRIAGFVFKPISSSSTHVQIITNTDPKLSYTPYWLLNLVTTQLSHYFFVMLRKQAALCNQPGSPYYERINTNPIYLELKQQLEDDDIPQDDDGDEEFYEEEAEEEEEEGEEEPTRVLGEKLSTVTLEYGTAELEVEPEAEDAEEEE